MPIDMTTYLGAATPADVKTAIDCWTIDNPGRLFYVGQCFKDLVETRLSGAHSSKYSRDYFDVDNSVLLTDVVTQKKVGAACETAGIQHGKRSLGTCCNVKSCDDVPHDRTSPERPGVVYLVPVAETFSSVKQFKKSFKSYYMQRNGGAGLKEQRRAQGLPP